MASILDILGSSIGQIVSPIITLLVLRWVVGWLRGVTAGQRPQATPTVISDSATTSSSQPQQFMPSTLGRRVSLLVVIALIGQLASLMLWAPGNVFTELELPRDTPNFLLRNAIRDVVGERLQRPDADIFVLHAAADESGDPESIRLVSLWSRLKTDAQRGLYCTFGERAFTDCEHCQTATDFTVYLIPTIGWEYMLVLVLVGFITSPVLTAHEVTRDEEDAAAADAAYGHWSTKTAALQVASAEQLRRKQRVRSIAGWTLLGAYIVEVLLFWLADQQRNDPLGVWEMPFLHDELWQLRRYLLSAVLAGVWLKGRTQPFTWNAQGVSQLTDPTAISTLMIGELLSGHRYLDAARKAQAAVQSDRQLDAHLRQHQQATARLQETIENDHTFRSRVGAMIDATERQQIHEQSEVAAKSMVLQILEAFNATEAAREEPTDKVDQHED